MKHVIKYITTCVQEKMTPFLKSDGFLAYMYWLGYIREYFKTHLTLRCTMHIKHESSRSQIFYKIAVFNKFGKIHSKALVSDSLFHKVTVFYRVTPAQVFSP